MKYYTYELWSGGYDCYKEQKEKVHLQWIKNDEEYSKIFVTVKELLPKKFMKIYLKEHGFHDYQLRNFEIIHGKEGYIDPVAVSMDITDGYNSWNIVYKKIKKISINYEQDIDNSKRRLYSGFDNYGYDEFFQIDEKTFSHEILFASGATILIHFEKIQINKITIE